MNLQTQVAGLDPVSAAHAILGHDGFSELAIHDNVLENVWPLLQAGILRMTKDSDAQARFAPRVAGTDELGWEKDVGLHRRTDRENKWFFHYMPGEFAPLAEDSYRDFLRACHALSKSAQSRTVEVAREIERFKGAGLVRAVQDGWVMTRILCYLDREIEKPDATTHFDRSGFTVHWASTHPGLILFDMQGRRHSVSELRTDHAAVFPGKKFPGFYQDPRLIRGCHGVRDGRRDSVDGSIKPRIAVVSFVHMKLDSDMARWIHGHKSRFDAIEERWHI